MAPSIGRRREPSADDITPPHVAGLADEFNRLLSTIQVDAAALEREGDSRAANLAEEILAASEQLASLSRALIRKVPAPGLPAEVTPATRASGDSNPVRRPDIAGALDINDLVLETAETLGKVLDGDVAVKTTLLEEPLPIQGDPQHLKQALFRLAVAARESMEPSGHLQFETQRIAITERQASWIGGATPGEYASLRLVYPACGKPPTDPQAHRGPDGRPRTSRFVRGLADAQRLVSEAKGHLQVAVTPGSPSWFTLFLPMAEPPEDATHKALRDTWPPNPNATVLVVDGDPAERTHATLILKAAGYRVMEAESAEEAAVLIEDEDHPPKLLVTDVMLPGLTGPDLAEQLGARYPELQVIYTSNLDRAVIVSCGDVTPDSPFLSKPCGEDALLTEVRRLLTPTG